jgi:periplasmic protein CpxP/Spy
MSPRSISLPRTLRRLGSGLALATALGASFSALAQPSLRPDPGTEFGDRFGEGRMHGGGGPEHMLRMGERVLDEVKATPEQRSQIKQLLSSAMAEMRQQREAGKGLREQEQKLFAQPNVDARAAETLRQQRMAQMDQASKRMMQLRLDIARVLTPEQRKLLADKRSARQEMRERHMRERRSLEGGSAPR